MLRKSYFGAFILTFALVSAYIFVLGESGYLERAALSKKKEILIERINSLNEGNLKLKTAASQSVPARDLDFLNAGFIPAGSRVLVLQGLQDEAKITLADAEAEYSPFHMNYLKGIYGAFAVLALLFYFTYFGRGSDYDA